jgi:hypothetical protein
MAQYIVNKNAQSNGDHEVHKHGCSYMPSPQHCEPLGDHAGCQTAVAAAKLRYSMADGCAYCCAACHRS